MNKYFYLAVLLYIGSFFMPVYDIIPGELSALGYECAYALAFKFQEAVAIGDSTIGHILQYILLNLSNPLIIIFIVASITNTLSKRTRWLIGNIAMISAVIFMPYFFMTLFTEFSFGYFSWLAAIILLNFLGNGNSFNRPQKNT